MAAIIAAVISAAATAGSAYYGSQAAKKAGKKKQTGTTTPTFTPQGQAVQDQMLRLLFNNLSSTPQNFQSFMQTGPQPAMNQSDIPFNQRRLLNLPTGLPQVVPSNVSPQLVAALQKLGIAPAGSVRAGTLPPGTQPAGPAFPAAPMTGPRR